MWTWAIHPVYEETCRYIEGHSQPIERLNVGGSGRCVQEGLVGPDARGLRRPCDVLKNGPKFINVGTERHLARTNVDGDIVGLNSTLRNPASLSHAR